MAAGSLNIEVVVTVGAVTVPDETRAVFLALGWTPPGDTHAPTVARWWRNGDHPHDRVGEPLLDTAALFDAHPELIDIEHGGMTGPIPDDAPTYRRVEGAVVRYLRHPETPGSSECGICGHRMHDHGWIDQGADGLVVCPGDVVVTVAGRHTVHRVADAPSGAGEE